MRWIPQDSRASPDFVQVPLKLVEVGLRESNAELDDVVRWGIGTLGPSSRGHNALLDPVHCDRRDGAGTSGEREGNPGRERAHC